jgi:hypothetical protein
MLSASSIYHPETMNFFLSFLKRNESCWPWNGGSFCRGPYSLHLLQSTLINTNSPTSPCLYQFWFSARGSLCLSRTSYWFLAWSVLLPWEWKRYRPPERLSISIGLHCVTSQKVVSTLHSHSCGNLRSSIILFNSSRKPEQYECGG